MNRRNLQYTCCPTRTERMKVARWTEGDLPGTRRLARFEMHVTWLRESETQTCLYWDGRPFKDGSTHCDFYGFLSSLDPEEGRRYVDEFKLAPNDRLTVRLVVKITDTPVTLIQQSNIKSRQGYEVLDGLYVGDEATFDRIESFDWNAIPNPADPWTPSDASLKPIVVKECPIWSSAKSDKENADGIAELKSSFGVVA